MAKDLLQRARELPAWTGTQQELVAQVDAMRKLIIALCIHVEGYDENGETGQVRL